MVRGGELESKYSSNYPNLYADNWLTGVGLNPKYPMKEIKWEAA